MKILFYQYGSICEPDIISVFSSFGLHVITEKTEIHNKGLSSSERIKLLSALIDAHQFAFVCSINFFPSISDLCQIYQLPYICWIVDSPVMELFSKSITNSCNRIFLFDKAQYQTFSHFHPNGIFYLPLATNVARWDQVNASITTDDRKKYSADISFIGSLYSEKNPFSQIKHLSEYTKGYIDGLLRAQEQIYGYNFLEETLPDFVISELKENLPGLFPDPQYTLANADRYTAAHQILGMEEAYLERLHTLQTLASRFPIALYTLSDTAPFAQTPNIHPLGGARTLTEMPKIFHLSKINLNITIKPIQTGLSLRIWDVLGSGGFLISNYQEELTDYFTPGIDLETYACLEELMEKCDFYLTHENARTKIACTGYQKVKASHTYEKRITKMLKIITENL